MKQTYLLYFLALFLLPACTKDDSGHEHTSTATSVGNGEAFAWVKTDHDGNPTSIGFTMNKTALVNLPAGSAATGHSTNYRLPLPSEASKTPFDHFDLGWVAQGHEPVGIYNVPHFDFHFYTIPANVQDAIPPYGVDSTKFKKDPPTGCIPTGYAKNPGGVPGMGCHWTDREAKEFKGGGFTETFIFGSYDGSVNFWESMITEAILKNAPNISRSIPQPTVFEKTGKFYPTTMRVYEEGNNIILALENLVKR